MRKKAALHNLGCKVNGYETQAMAEALEKAGYEIVPFGPGADVYVINTCTVTNIADRKSRQMLHRARQMDPSACVVAVGCDVREGVVSGDDSVDIWIENREKNTLVPRLDAFFKGTGECAGGCRPDEKKYEEMSITSSGSHVRAYVKIQDGCDQFCTYCRIPYVRGRSVSRGEDEIIREIETLAGNGVKEVVLTGIHVSSYGLPAGRAATFSPEKAETNQALLSLLRKTACVRGIERIRLGSLEASLMTEGFVRGAGEIGKLCPQFHISLQSGCDRTLAAMGRRYRAEAFAERCALIRDVFPKAAITTDIIAGFPGETEEDHASSVAFAERMAFAKMHVFPFSPRTGTPAAKMKDQIPGEVKIRRAKELQLLGDRMREAYIKSFDGSRAEVLLEEEMTRDGVRYLTGYTREYIPCLVPAGSLEAGDVVSGTLSAKGSEAVLETHF